MNIFVSYTTRNNEVSRNLLQYFSNKLEISGRVFIDLINNNSLNRQARVISELKLCDLLILIWTPSALSSEWVSLEIEIAKRKNIPILEISVDEIFLLSKHELRRKVLDQHSDSRVSND